MNRGQLVETLAKKNNIPKSQADVLLSSVIETIQTGVQKDGEVRLVGFGTFKSSERKARTGRNPQTGATIKIKKKTVAKFVASKNWDPKKPILKSAAKKVTRLVK